jgi:pyruvate,water dikinase
MPGSSPAGVEEQFFGSVREGVDNRNNPRRYPIVMARAPVAIGLLNRRLERVRADTDRWWRASVFPGPDDPSTAHILLVEASRRFQEIMTVHVLTSMLAQGAFDQVQKLAKRAQHPGLETTLLTGAGSLEETALAAELWRAARSELPIADFVTRYGFHGPNEGDVSSQSWREDLSPLSALLDAYKAKPDDEAPGEMLARRRDVRANAEREFYDGLSPSLRGPARALLAATRGLLRRREVGKAAFLQTIDAARCATRVLGRSFTNPDDVYFLTLDELLAGHHPPDDLIAFRRERREEYRHIRLPEVWTGNAVAAQVQDVPAALVGDTFDGLAVAPGVVEGRVRRIVDSGCDTAPLEPGEILVCHTTDPSWVTVFMTASALVIDVGGHLSHGAIVARELGIPCVINTITGTQRLHDGQRIRVDGNQGRVDVLV